VGLFVLGRGEVRVEEEGAVGGGLIMLRGEVMK
jgi:hypothetical protein